MLTKSRWRARIAALAAVTVVTACSSALPWGDEAAREVNLAFTLERNLIYLTTASIDGRPGRYMFASANSRSAVDPALAQTLPGQRHKLQLNARRAVALSPVVVDLAGLAEAIIGADVWGNSAVTIDYRSGLVTWQLDGIHPDSMALFTFAAEPSVVVRVNGEDIPAIVDTASPDTLVLPRRSGRDRARARVALAGTDFGEIDIALTETSRARIGNRLLSKFLVTIDYGRRQVGLWRDPRIPLVDEVLRSNVDAPAGNGGRR